MCAQFGLVAYLKTKFESNAKSVASRRGWDFGRMDNPVKSLYDGIRSPISASLGEVHVVRQQ